jgi:propionyl-CoA synthetase
MGRFDEVHARSLKDPEGFWGEAAAKVHWYRTWDMVLDSRSAPFYHWFTGGLTNTCYNALDRHVEGGRAEQAALIYDSPVTDTVKSYTYRELRDMTALCAGALSAMGVGKGDRVIIYMPMVPEAVVAMLACARCTPSSSAASPRTNWRCASTTRSRRSSSRPPAASR